MNWSYIAGFFDGEGSITRVSKGVRISISQTNEPVLNDIKEFAGYGFVFKNRKRQPHWKDSWVYYIARQEEVYKFLKSVYPHLTVKKELAQKTIPRLNSFVIRQKKQEKKRTENKKQAKILREQGLTYRQIGAKLGIDFGHVRRLVLNLKKHGGSSSAG